MIPSRPIDGVVHPLLSLHLRLRFLFLPTDSFFFLIRIRHHRLPFLADKQSLPPWPPIERGGGLLTPNTPAIAHLRISTQWPEATRGYVEVLQTHGSFGAVSDLLRQVNARDDDDFIDSPTEPLPRPTHPIPNSPPPSFRSRASSRERNQLVNPDLADAFDDDTDSSDDEGDDRQRLVRGSGGATPNDAASTLSSQTQGTTTCTTPTPAAATGSAPTSGRVYGGGIQSDGVFSNLTAKPELGGEQKEELPPVCFPRTTVEVRR